MKAAPLLAHIPSAMAKLKNRLAKGNAGAQQPMGFAQCPGGTGSFLILRGGAALSFLSSQAKEQRAAFLKLSAKLPLKDGKLEAKAQAWHSFCALLLQHCAASRAFLLPCEALARGASGAKGFICGDPLGDRNGGASTALPRRRAGKAGGWSAQACSLLSKEGAAQPAAARPLLCSCASKGCGSARSLAR